MAQQGGDDGWGVKVTTWHAIASWTWNAGDDVCGICRSHFDGCPPNIKYPGDDAPVVWGACKHAFHLPCISKWLEQQTEPQCPLCRRAWEFSGGPEGATGGGEGQ
ncbi:unnamed protein product [Pedinophyceae sp. YPF-701]|nr:unnamed protein product [Pedinophyceae sp. YPF-701]